jgi:hypothetical protein
VLDNLQLGLSKEVATSPFFAPRLHT